MLRVSKGPLKTNTRMPIIEEAEHVPARLSRCAERYRRCRKPHHPSPQELVSGRERATYDLPSLRCDRNVLLCYAG